MEQERKRQNILRSDIIYIALFFVLILVIWIGFLFAPQPNVIIPPEVNGFCDLSGYDFEDTVYHVNNTWESWPYQLYTPEDFAIGNATGSPRFLKISEAMNTSYATHRLYLSLPPGKYYGISMVSSEYAMRIYIDGREIDSVGSPGKTRETTEHRVAERTYYFLPEHETVTIIVQTANFAHDDGSGAPDFFIGTSDNITERNNAATIVSFLIVGCLIATALYHVGLFCLNRTRKIDLIFAACCLLLALMNKKLLLLFWPDYIFSIAIRLEYTVHFLTFAFLVLFLEALHPLLLHKHITRSYYALSGLFLMTLFLDSLIFTRLIIVFEIVSIFMIGYVLVRLAMALRKRRVQNYLSFVGVLVLGLMGANDILYYQNITIIPPIDSQFFLSPVGMIFFVFCYALAMSAGYAETEKAMLEAKEKEQQLSNENAAFERINALTKKLMDTISHEARTPLAILASYAGLVAMELRDKGMDEQTTADLDTIAFEAKRVANLIDSMRHLTLSTEQMSEHICLNLGDISRQTAHLYLPILERNDIMLEIQADDNLPPVLGNPAELTQVLFNLLQNSKNHTASGSISISVRHDNDYVTACIADTGTGIDPQLLPYIFERGVRGNDGGSGIGLAVCKEVITAHGGTIQISSERGKGTKVTAIFPVYKERGNE